MSSMVETWYQIQAMDAELKQMKEVISFIKQYPEAGDRFFAMMDAQQQAA